MKEIVEFGVFHEIRERLKGPWKLISWIFTFFNFRKMFLNTGIA